MSPDSSDVTLRLNQSIGMRLLPDPANERILKSRKPLNRAWVRIMTRLTATNLSTTGVFPPRRLNEDDARFNAERRISTLTAPIPQETTTASSKARNANGREAEKTIGRAKPKAPQRNS